jgi:hypothetical protein
LTYIFFEYKFFLKRLQMPGYRNREKEKHILRGNLVFGSEAGRMGGTYNKIKRPFCLPDRLSTYNLHKSIRQDAIDYFIDRRIPWHDGQPNVDPETGRRIKSGNPSNHVCCSQSQCVNALYPFRRDPDALKRLLSNFGFDVAECLPILADHGEQDAFVGFEWIGVHNYLMEYQGGRPARCDERSRGANFTSADFIFRFKNANGKIHVILGEWKYTEDYRNTKSKALGSSGATRLSIYKPLINNSGMRMGRRIKLNDLLYEPFYQMMRLQLLSAAMEKPVPGENSGEMNADIISVLHVSPSANEGLRKTVTSPALRSVGNDIYDVWDQIAPKERFHHIDSDTLIDLAISENKPTGWDNWAQWMRRRYL